jgi:hypothetical protein
MFSGLDIEWDRNNVVRIPGLLSLS